ncbi:MAG: UDP-N-acetylmuramoyl-L-alanine--D-glutamate ligase, partial [Candidatus Omnitrophota bacterium]
MKTDLKNKKVTVVGLARSGLAAALLLKELGAEVYATDSGNSEDLIKSKLLLEGKGVNVEIGAHSRGFIEEKDLVVVSPGVAENASALRWAREDRIPLISEIELGYLCCAAPIVAVTGTNGKSTTASLIGDVLRAGGKDVVVCGNIGNPFCAEMSKIKKNSVVVLEVSSFQLENIKYFRPYVSVALNISQNHFDRHPDLDAYLNAKAKIFHNQSEDDWAVLNGDDPLVKGLESKTKARVVFFSREAKERAYFRDGSMFISNGAIEEFVCEASELKIKGGHNVDNVLACLCVASIFGVSCAKAAGAIKAFNGLEHRFEYVTSINGV